MDYIANPIGNINNLKKFKKGNQPWNKNLKGYLAKEKHWNWKGGISKTPQMSIIYNNRHRALKYLSKERLTLHDWELIKIQYDYKCAYCGKTKKLTIDHIKPLSKGGSDGKDNIQPLCKSCNSRKSATYTVDAQ